MIYQRQYWVDHTEDQQGHVIEQGTLLDQDHFNHIEAGLSDQSLAAAIMQFKDIQESFEYADEMHMVTLGQTGIKWPFNNSASTIALLQLRENNRYSVEVDVLSYSGGRLGNIKVFDRANNGFKLLHDGSATNVQVSIRVSGGILS